MRKYLQPHLHSHQIYFSDNSQFRTHTFMQPHIISLTHICARGVHTNSLGKCKKISAFNDKHFHCWMVLINKIHVPFNRQTTKKLTMLMNDMTQFDKSYGIQSNFWIVLINTIHNSFIQTNDKKLHTYVLWSVKRLVDLNQIVGIHQRNYVYEKIAYVGYTYEP